MNEGLIPRRYAKALYKVALERKVTDKIYSMANALVANAAQSPALGETLSNPFVADSDKMAILASAAGNTAADDHTFADFLKLLAQNRRLDMTLDIARSYADIYRSENRISRVKLTSAAPVSEEVLLRIKNLINAQLNGGSMEFSSSVDPDLIGGFTVAIDNQRLDASVRNELNQLRLNLLK